MGYSRSEKTLLKMLPKLNNLQQGKDTQWKLAEGVEPEDFAYKVREALYVAALFPQKYPELAKARDNFKVEIVDRNTVQAVFKPYIAARAQETGITVTHGLQHGEAAPTTLAGPQTAMTVIQAWHNSQPSNTPLRFPQAQMDKEELTTLYNWAMKRTPAWYMFVDNNGGLVLQPYSRDLEGLNWDPSDEE